MTMSRYVALEGVDGAGKTTVARAVAGQLRRFGHDVLEVREPGGTTSGEAIRRILLERGGAIAPWTEALLFAAGRAQLAAEVIGPALATGKAVLSDRRVYSSLAYQGGARDLGFDLVRSVNAAGLQGVWPGLVIVLRVDPETGLRREDEADRISVEGIALQERVAAAYDHLAASEPERVVTIDAGLPFDEVVSSAVHEVTERW
jgi:dTMP kinase